MLNFQYDKAARWSDCNAIIRPNRNGSRKDHVMAESYRTCEVDGCNGKHVAKGLCGKHYDRLRATGSTYGGRYVRPLRISGDCAHIPLTRGYEAVIDASDAHLVEGLNWHTQSGVNTVYATRTAPKADGEKQKTIWMHRLIMSAPDGLEVDHIDGDGLNNRKSNLRIATRVENRQNSRRQNNNTSGYKGVCWHKGHSKWRAQIRLNNKRTHLGYFDCPKEAHAAYCEASVRLHGEFGRTE